MAARSLVQVRRLEDGVFGDALPTTPVMRDRAPRESATRAAAMWAMAAQQVQSRDGRALKTLRWVALIVLPPMVQTMADYCQYRLDGGDEGCIAQLRVDSPAIACSNSGPLDAANLFWNSLFHGVGVLPATVPTWLCGWNRLGRLTIMSLTTFIMLSKVMGAGLYDPRGFLTLLRWLGWQIATTELLLPTRNR